MSRLPRQHWPLILFGFTLLVGCNSSQPFYLNEDGDLSHYVDVATDIEYPDVAEASLGDASRSIEPMTVTNPDFESIWDLSLEDAIDITLQNSKVIRTFGQVRQLGQLTHNAPEVLTNNPDFAATIYDPALQEANPGVHEAHLQGRPSALGGASRFAPGEVIGTGEQGVEAALSEFDAVFSASASLNKGDRPRSSTFFGDITSDTGRGEFQIAKHTAAGTNFYIRNLTEYVQSSQNGRSQISDWTTSFEVEARHPLLQGSGTQVNRVPVVLARIRTDISLADFEGSVRDLVSDTERAYWELHFAFRTLETAKAARDSALMAWRTTHAKMLAQAIGGEADKVAQAQEQYFAFRFRVEEALRDVYKAETRLRYLMGLAATDGRLIRPIDEPTLAHVDFDWCDIHCEALARSVELRRQKWRIAQREQEMIFARNALLPSLDVVGMYRWLGQGDDLIAGSRRGGNFPADGSQAFDELTEGRYQEYSFGLEFQVPLGFRQELAGVRHAQLSIARDRAVLEDMELEVTHQLTSAIQDLDTFYVLAQTSFNRRTAAEQQVNALQTSYEGGRPVLDLLLEAQRRLADAEIQYYQSVVNYNLAVMMVHHRKGSLLEYNGVVLAEGPWPQKAYRDAHNLARQRDASHYMNYGYTRPRVISQGQFPQMVGGQPGEQGLETSGFEYGPSVETWEEVSPEMFTPPVPTEMVPTRADATNQVQQPQSLSRNPIRATSGVESGSHSVQTPLESTQSTPTGSGVVPPTPAPIEHSASHQHHGQTYASQ